MPLALVSIILPVYNRADLLPRAVESVLRQRYRWWELLIIDDGSTDETRFVAAEYAGLDSRIVYLHQLNQGPSAARNLGLRVSRGSYVGFLDSDDEYLPGHIDARVRFMQHHSRTAFLHGGVHILGSADRQLVPDRFHPERLIPLAECVIGGTFFARKGIIERAGGWRNCYGEDADLFDRIARMVPTRKIEENTYLYHRESGGGRCDTERYAGLRR